MTDPLNRSSASKPTVTIVIPARNAASTLAQTLDSLIAQTFQDWEAIIVDDGSIDATSEIVASYALRDSRIGSVPGPRRGVSAARNLGVAYGRGELIAFLDADDLWMPTKLAQHVALLADRPDIGMSFDRILFVDLNAASTGVFSTERVQGLERHDFLYENPACTASTLVVRRMTWDLVGGFDESLNHAEDLELMIRVRCQTSWGVEGLNAVLTHYRASANGASANLVAMQSGWELVMSKVKAYAPELVADHLRAARAVHLRYLARRALRLGQPAAVGFKLLGQAVLNSPIALLYEPRRTIGTFVGLVAYALCGAFGPSPRT